MSKEKFQWKKFWKTYLFNIAEYPNHTDLVWLQVDQSERPLPSGYVGWHGVETKKFTNIEDAFEYLAKNYNFYLQNSIRFINGQEDSHENL